MKNIFGLIVASLGILFLFSGCVTENNVVQTKKAVALPTQFELAKKVDQSITKNFTEYDKKAISKSGLNELKNEPIDTATEITLKSDNDLQTGFFADIKSGTLSYKITDSKGSVVFNKDIKPGKPFEVDKVFSKPIKGTWTLSVTTIDKTTGYFGFAAQQEL